jgi:hypothetical protein
VLYFASWRDLLLVREAHRVRTAEREPNVLKTILWITLSLGVGSAVAVESAKHFFGGGPGHKYDPEHPLAAPEIDPASALSALTLLAGGLAVLRGRTMKKQ